MYYEYHDFSKRDKKKLVALLDVGVKQEIEHFLKKSLPVHQEIVSKQHEDIRKPFWAYYETFNKFTKHLQLTYDGWSHRELPAMIAQLLATNILQESDLVDFSPEGRKKLAEMEARFE